MKPDETLPADVSLRHHAVAGFAMLGVLFGGLGAWAAVTNIGGAVIAPGQIVVETNAKSVQHPDGGVVAELRVKDGDFVKSGDLLIRLDDTLMKANLSIVTKQIDEFLALEGRLVAERDNLPEITYAPDFLARAKDNPDVAAAIAGHLNAFKNRRITNENRRVQLDEQIKQLESSIGGLESQYKSRGDEVGLIERELKGVEELFKKNLVPLTRLVALQREKTRLEGERAKLTSDIAAARGSIAEKRIAILRIDDDFRSDVAKELNETRAKLAEFGERRVAAQDKLTRVEIRAPQSGRIHASTVYTVGGVLKPSETAMLVVPQEDRLIVDAIVEPNDINEVRVGQIAVVKFTAFSEKNLKDFPGEVINVAPDLIEEPATKRRFYKIRISVGTPTDPNGKPLPLVPGMPVETFLAKGDRTVLAYLVRPLTNAMGRVFRE